MSRDYFETMKSVGHKVDFEKKTRPAEWSDWSKIIDKSETMRKGENAKKQPLPSKHDDSSEYAKWVKEYMQDWPANAPPPNGPPTKENTSMANKFLPFIVDSSTPKHIFKTLMSRSKGMNILRVASIFNLTLNVNIKELRDTVAKMEELSLDSIYEELLQKFEQYRVDEDVLSYFRGMVEYRYMPTDKSLWDDSLNEFPSADIMSFLCVVSKLDKSDKYSKIDFSGLHSPENIFSNIKEYVTFSDDGIVVQFKNMLALKTYILYRALIQKQVEPGSTMPNVCAEFAKDSATRGMQDNARNKDGSTKFGGSS